MTTAPPGREAADAQAPAAFPPSSSPLAGPRGARARTRTRIALRRATAAGAALVLAAAFAGPTTGVPAADWLRHPVDSVRLARGENPHPVRLVLPPAAPQSAVARLGERLFHDPRLSGSGRQSCASCHDPAHGFGPPNALSVQVGGRDMDRAGARAVPSLRYLYREAPFSIGPDNEEVEGVDLRQLAQAAAGRPRATKSAATPGSAAASLVPQGGLFWDGRADTLQQQAAGPLFNPLEMDAGDPARVARVLQEAGYAPPMRQLFGPAVFADPRQAVAEAMFAIARFQVENADLHAFSSKYDAWLQGRARLAPAEQRGLQVFEDPARGNCAACHLDRPTRDGLPPLFTDGQYEALGVPRNAAIPANRDPAYFDRGLCGPYRTDLRDQHAYCGMFRTPTLRNVATRHAFFHNGVYHDLRQVLAFYDLRDAQPEKVYPRGADGRVRRFDDLPPADRANVDTRDAPFGRAPGAAPPMSARDLDDLRAFLGTLTDGWRPAAGG